MGKLHPGLRCGGELRAADLEVLASTRRVGMFGAFMAGQVFNCAMRRIVSASVVAALVGASVSSAWGQPAPVTYPPSRALGDIASWLQHDTPLLPAQIVDISPAAVTAITAATPMGETRGFLTAIAAEAMDPTIVGHDGMASWSIPVEIDCDRRVARLGAMTGYHSRDLHTEPKIIREADSAWVTPVETAPLSSVIRALCDRDFQRPLLGNFKAATAPAARLKPTPSAAPAEAKTPEVKLPETKSPQSKSPLPKSSQPKVHTAVTANAGAPATGGAYAVQVGASPSQADTQGLLTHFKAKFADKLGGLTPHVATVVVDGKTINRALVSGFSSSAAANSFCKAVSDSGQACFVRR